MSLEEKVTIILDENGKEVVQMNMDVFKAIESCIEDQGLLKAILENDPLGKLNEEDALKYYSDLEKAE